MTVDWTISLGNILQIVSVLGGGLLVLVAIRMDVQNLKSDVTSIKAELKKIAEVMVITARQDERLKSQDERIKSVERGLEDLRHGKGFVMEDFAGRRVI